MRNYKFWEKYSGNTLWEKVREFVENHELTCGLMDETQDEYIADLIGLIESVKDVVSDEERKESLREDVLCTLIQKDEKYGEKLFRILPIKRIDTLIEDWQDDLNDDANYAETRDGNLDKQLYQQSWMAHFDEFDEKDVQAYFAYLQEWFLTHNEGEPVCIREFLDCEMQDADYVKYYKGQKK